MWESLDKHRVLYIGSPTITKRTKESRVSGNERNENFFRCIESLELNQQ
jgi:hypothetical protein